MVVVIYHGFPSDIDVLRGVPPVSSLCFLCCSGTRSAQTCFSLPPLNSRLWGRSQRSWTVTYPGGGWSTPLFFCWGWVSPLYFVYTWVPYSLLDPLTECRKLLYPVSGSFLDCSDRSISSLGRVSVDRQTPGTGMTRSVTKPVKVCIFSAFWRVHLITFLDFWTFQHLLCVVVITNECVWYFPSKKTSYFVLLFVRLMGHLNTTAETDWWNFWLGS